MIEKMQWLTWWGRKCTDVIFYRQIVHRVNTGIIAFDYIVRFVYVTTLLVYSIDSNIQCTAFCFFILCCTPILLFVIEHVLCDDVCIGGINNDYNRINMKFGFEAAKSILANKCSENRTACNENRIQWPLLRVCVCKSQSLTTVYVYRCVHVRLYACMNERVLHLVCDYHKLYALWFLAKSGQRLSFIVYMYI